MSGDWTVDFTLDCTEINLPLGEVLADLGTFFY